MDDGQTLPHFLGIGGQRCGSKWLYTNLKPHPAVWLPPVKELHYFNRSAEYDAPSTLTDGLFGRLFGDEEYNRRFRKRAQRTLKKASWRDPQDMRWKLRYFFGRPSDKWYASLFRPGRGKVRGEITPAYAILNRRDVEHVHRLMPQAKIIFILRNPIARTWSGVQLGLRMKTMTQAQADDLLLGPAMSSRSDYMSSLSTWASVFPREQMFVEFFEEIVENPERLLTRVYDFLGVASGPEYLWPTIREKQNAAPQQPMPSDVKLALTKKYAPQIAALADRLGGHATHWLEEARATLGRTRRAA